MGTTVKRQFGAYRFVRHESPGIVWACMDCKNMFWFMDDPFHYNFCPKCGMSWFKQWDCRPRHVPRWAWDRGLIDYKPPVVEPTSWWVIEAKKPYPSVRQYTEHKRIPYRLNSFREAQWQRLWADSTVMLEHRVRLVCSRES